ncbi:MAG: dihydroxyacetone kinase subunit DhaK [Chloroflexi bacterium]|nr:MAG: dihydroxyacetone kinase subunit DhaK [Chloroflexota bacterium]
MAEAAVTTRLKKLINAPETEVRDALAGMAAAHADLIRVEYDPNVIIRKDAPKKGKVGLVSGGGSGHEPMHGGYVGLGMLDAACPGAVFTSPTPDQMARATKAVDGGAGVLHIVKNYTGDIMNFEMAAELARGDGEQVNAVVTNDDVAVQDSLYTAGRRGVGVTVLLEKIVGGCAEAGADLATVTNLAKKVNANGRSMGMALTSCTVPAAGKPTFEIADDEMELGIGIHAFVNGMGGTPLIELYVIYNDLTKLLDGRGITITRNLIGPYITSLEMAGCSVTLLKLDAEMTRFWDAPVHTPALRWGV